MSFLETVVASTRARLADLPPGEPPPRGSRPSFPGALAGRDALAVIAEVKRSSPSRGALAPAADAAAQARRYAAAGAAAVSVLTEPRHFGGELADLEAVAGAVDLPVLMKDFVLSPEQVRVAALLGASAVLIVLRLVDDALLAELAAACAEHDLAPLLEVHDERELERALPLDGPLGINNRDLDTLAIDLGAAPRLAARVPAGRVLVAESGYAEPAAARALRGRFDAVLIGSALMTGGDPAAFLREVLR